MTDLHPFTSPGTLTAYPPGRGRPAAFRGPFSEIWRLLCSSYLKLSGWRVEGDWPRQHGKMILVAAPHTSNWDGVNMLAAAGHFRIKLAWMGKKSLTTGPLGWLVKAMGCVPVDRKAKNDVVAQMVSAMAAASDMVLAIPPEGTRSHTREWKSGFYHIAHGAGVPIVLSVLDYGTKTIRLAGEVTPSGDFEADLPVIRSAYAHAKGLHQDKFEGGADHDGE